ncbi:hypothetical protein FHS31_001354 [Sphingomonas vulcanisoli]|uniref:General secretion pathway protein N n=1 Tax=Sphingomonas vulcanisoli TaxID=1658060 RepID=A0ABX0TUA1_9SPHN|nr:hypothetical protein [Sphingomonas vulcanisoli]NIJ07744.1 hypothetical protein [Sphingomonas vulcanisoli]
MPRGLSAELTAAAADPAASQRAPIVTRRSAVFIAIGVLAYLVALIASWPARFALTPSPRFAVAGTVWSGEAVIDGAYRIQWRWAPWRSLASFAYAADVRLTGTGTDIAGSATRISGGYAFEGLAGRGDGALLAALAPSLPFACDTTLQIDLPKLRIAGAASAAVGSIRADGGSCAAKGSAETSPLPPLRISALAEPGNATRITAAPLGQARRQMIEGGIASGRLTLTPTHVGIALLPLLATVRIDSAL